MLQRVCWARVEVEGEEIAAIGHGLLALVGIAVGDGAADAERLADKTVRLRIFAGDGDDKPFDLALGDVPGAALLCVSQFTLIADLRRGNRPGWSGAARPEVAAPLVELYAEAVAARGVPVARGRFGATMAVSLENDGPVTIVLGSPKCPGSKVS